MARTLLEELYGDAVIEVSARPTAWQMAQSATTAAAKFVAGGMQRVAPDVREQRLKACGECGHFNGTQCAVCGCVIAAKTWFPAETCPVGKWER